MAIHIPQTENTGPYGGMAASAVAETISVVHSDGTITASDQYKTILSVPKILKEEEIRKIVDASIQKATRDQAMQNLLDDVGVDMDRKFDQLIRLSAQYPGTHRYTVAGCYSELSKILRGIVEETIECDVRSAFHQIFRVRVKDSVRIVGMYFSSSTYWDKKTKDLRHGMASVRPEDYYVNAIVWDIPMDEEVHCGRNGSMSIPWFACESQASAFNYDHWTSEWETLTGGDGFKYAKSDATLADIYGGAGISEIVDKMKADKVEVVNLDAMDGGGYANAFEFAGAVYKPNILISMPGVAAYIRVKILDRENQFTCGRSVYELTRVTYRIIGRDPGLRVTLASYIEKVIKAVAQVAETKSGERQIAEFLGRVDDRAFRSPWWDVFGLVSRFRVNKLDQNRKVYFRMEDGQATPDYYRYMK